MDLRFKHPDVCLALREYMERRGMTPPEDDKDFVLLSVEGGGFVVEVASVAIPALAERGRAPQPPVVLPPRDAADNELSDGAPGEPPAMDAAPSGLDMNDAFDRAMDDLAPEGEGDEDDDDPEVDDAAFEFTPEADAQALSQMLAAGGVKVRPAALMRTGAGKPSGKGVRRPGGKHQTMSRFRTLKEAGVKEGDVSGEID